PRPLHPSPTRRSSDLEPGAAGRVPEAAQGVSTPEARLATLGLVLPPVAAPVAAYVPAVRTGSYVYTAGQLPLAEGKLLATGKVRSEEHTSELQSRFDL